MRASRPREGRSSPSPPGGQGPRGKQRSEGVSEDRCRVGEQGNDVSVTHLRQLREEEGQLQEEEHVGSRGLRVLRPGNEGTMMTTRV